MKKRIVITAFQLILALTASSQEFPATTSSLELLRYRTATTPIRLRVAPLTTITQGVRLIADSTRDAEPAIAVDVQGANETDYTIWMRHEASSSAPSVKAAVTQRVNGSVTQTSLIGPAHNYAINGDPVVVVSHWDGGFQPRRAYMFYTDYNGSSGGIINASITVTTSNNNFTVPITVYGTTESVVFLDKPAAAISEYSGSLGEVYCAFLEMREQTIANRILVSRLNPVTGQWSLAGEVALPTDHVGIHSPQIAIDPYSGHIYVAYINQLTNLLYMSHGTPTAWPGGLVSVTFDAPLSVGAGVTFYHNGTPEGPLHPRPDTLDFDYYGIQAVSQINARYNNTDHSIGVVFHGNNGATHGYLARFVPGTGWTGVTQVTPSAGEQWNCALDDDSQGRYMLTYYKRPYPGPSLFQTCGLLISATGSPLASEVCAESGGFTDFDGAGEYQDVAYANGVWRAATVHQFQSIDNYLDIWQLTFQP